jgi:drug/metabolite transporter (DMT)-like permease
MPTTQLATCLPNRSITVRRRALAYSALVLAVFIWGINFVVVQNGINAWGERKFTFLAVRFWIACIAYAAILIVQHGSLTKAFMLTPKAIFHASVVGLVLAGGYGFQTWYLVDHSPVNAAFLTSTTVLWAPLLAAVFHQRVFLTTTAGAIVALIGIALIQLHDLALWPLDLIHWFAVLAAIFFAIEILLVSRFAPSDKAIQWTAVSCFTVAVLMTVLAVVREDWSWPADQAASRILAVVFTGIFATAVALGLQNWAQAQEVNQTKIIDGPRAAIISTLEPVFTAAFSLLLFLLGFTLYEPFSTPYPVIGCFLILIGTLVSELAAARRAQKRVKAEGGLSS